MSILVITPGYWGKGKDLTEAKTNCKKAGASSIAKRIVYTCDDTAWVDEMGSLRWPKGNERPVEIENTFRKR